MIWEFDLKIWFENLAGKVFVRITDQAKKSLKSAKFWEPRPMNSLVKITASWRLQMISVIRFVMLIGVRWCSMGSMGSLIQRRFWTWSGGWTGWTGELQKVEKNPHWEPHRTSSVEHAGRLARHSTHASVWSSDEERTTSKFFRELLVTLLIAPTNSAVRLIRS